MNALNGSSPAGSLVETYPPVAESVSRARRALARIAAARGAAMARIDAVRLAVSEAMTNAVLQGAGTGGDIRVRAEVIEDTLAVSIEDDSPRTMPMSPGRGLGPGVGLALIAQAADELAIAHGAVGGTEVRMRFGLGLSPRT